MEPSPNSTNERFFWFRIVRMDPVAVISWPSFIAGVARIVATFGSDVFTVDDDRCNFTRAEELAIPNRVDTIDRRAQRHIIALN